jgi:WD40 repeat protein
MVNQENRNITTSIKSSHLIHLSTCLLTLIVILACGTSRNTWKPAPFPQPELAITADTISQVQELVCIPQPGWVNALSWSPDGTVLAVATSTYSAQQWDGEVQLWDASIGEPFKTIKITGIHQLAFSPNGKLLAGIGSHGLLVWSVPDGIELIQQPLSQFETKHVAFSSDGSHLAFRHKNIIQLLEMPTGDQLVTIPQKGEDIEFAFFPNEPMLITAGRNKSENPTFSIWDITTGKEIDSYPLPISLPIEIQGSILLPGTMLAAIPIRVDAVGMFDLRSGDLLLEWGGFRFDVPHFTFSPDGSVLAAGEGVGFEVASPSGLRLLDVINNQEVPMLKGHKGVIVDLGFSPDGCFLATGSEDKTICLWGVPADTGE